jgi:CubicO group peptidase (beta-lactamase class C family)
MAVSPSALGKVLEVFERNFRERGEIGASLSIWWQGTELLAESAGWCELERTRAWSNETLIPVYSATKVPAAATLLLALERHGLSAATPVTEVWPRFPVAAASFAQLLSHQCGLAALDRPAAVLDHAAVIAAIEAQAPAWPLGTGCGYHPRTFGALADEAVRRLTGMTLGRFWTQEIALPLALDCWIGLPEIHVPRVARLYPGKLRRDAPVDAFYQALRQAGTYSQRAFASPSGLHAIHEMNQPSAWAAGLPAFGGVATASALAKFYQAAIGAIDSPLSAEIRHALATVQIAAEDRVLLRPMAYTCGAQQDPLAADGQKLRQLYGPSRSAFGHPGAGGAHAFGDPETGIAFAYTMNQMELSVMPTSKCLEMITALFSEM